jgi:FtsH-binding integral membrane protein
MSFESDLSSRISVGGDAAFDAGLRAFLSRVYLKVAGGLALSAGEAWCVAHSSALRDLLFVQVQGEVAGFTGWGLTLVFAPVVVMFLASFVVRDQGARGSGVLYWTIAALVGGSLSVLVLTYAGASLVSTFLVTACAFVALSLWGFATKRNLSGFGNFMLAGLAGLIVAMVVSLFLRSSALYFVLDALGVLIFSGLIAADTQRLRRIYEQGLDPQALEASANYGALTLYLNFINLFELLLSLTGSRSRR